jgi:hypothetical protein
VIDFFDTVNNDIGRKEIFKDETFPEDYFYNKLVDEVWALLYPLIRF